MTFRECYTFLKQLWLTIFKITWKKSLFPDWRIKLILPETNKRKSTEVSGCLSGWLQWALYLVSGSNIHMQKIRIGDWHMFSMNVHCRQIGCMTFHRNWSHARVTNIFIQKLKHISKLFDLLTSCWRIEKLNSSVSEKKATFLTHCRGHYMFALVCPYTEDRLGELQKFFST